MQTDIVKIKLTLLALADAIEEGSYHEMGKYIRNILK